MSTLSEHISLTISAQTTGVARAGFGIPLIVSHNATWSERIRFYGGIQDVVSDFVAGTPEYLAASAMFAQSPHPEQIAIGRASLKPTQVYVINAQTITNNHDYKVTASGPGITKTTVTYTSDGTATNDEIATGLVSALNGVTGKNYTAAATGSAGSQVVTVTGNAAGNWFSLEIVAGNITSDDLRIKQTHADPGIVTDLTAIQTENDTWYAVLTMYNSIAYVEAVAAWIETQPKIYMFAVNETAALKTTVGGGDTLDALNTLKYNRTAGCYHPSPISFFAAAYLGARLPIDPGSDDWKWVELEGVAPVTTTATDRVNLRARNANTFQTIAGVDVTWEGTVAGGSYGFVDITRGLDWLTDDMSKGVFSVFLNKKTPYTNAGISAVTSAVRRSLKRAIANGILADDGLMTVSAPNVDQVTSTNKAQRTLPNVKFSATLAGSIHKVTITGTVSV